MSDRPVVLIISGLDPANGAGIGRDIITVKECGCHPVSIPSVLTVQNSISFERSYPVDTGYILDALGSLEKELSFSSVKIGLLPFDEEWTGALASFLERYSVPVVIDPVLKATADNSAFNSFVNTYRKLITDRNKVLTPNLRELEILHKSIYGNSGSQLEMASRIAKELLCTVITTFEGSQPVVNITTSCSSTDIPLTIHRPEIRYHGTGCAFSSAIASFLAKGETIETAVKISAQYLLEKVKSSSRFHPDGQNYL